MPDLRRALVSTRMNVGRPRPGARLVLIPVEHFAYLMSRSRTTHVPLKHPALHLERLEPENAWCECEEPDWRSASPFFVNVRECARCGSPDRDQIGRWP